MEKTCNTCGVIKALSGFYFDKARNRHKGKCRECVANGYAKRVREARHESVLVRNTGKRAAQRIADIAAHRPVVVVKAGQYFRVISAKRFIGIYDAGCDYRDVLREIA